MVATIGLLALFLTFFFLQDGDRAWGWAFQATTGRARERIGSAGHDALERVGGYLRGMAVLASIKAISDFVFLTLLGVPLAAPLAVMVFIGGFIPYVGGFITTTILVLVTLSTQGVGAVVLLLIGITIVNVVNGNILGPVIYGKTVSIHPALVLVSLPAGAAVAGIIGLFVAIPLVAIVLAVWGALLTILDPGPEYETPDLVPGWLDRLAQWSVRLLALIVLALVAIQIVLLIPTVAVSIVLGVVLAATFRPFVGALVRRGWRRGPASAVTTAGIFLAVIVVVILAAISLINQGAAIAATSTSGAQEASDAVSGAIGPLVAMVGSVGPGVASGVASFAAGIASLGVILLLSGLLCFYFLLDGQRFWGNVRQRLHGDRLDEIDAAAGRAVSVLSGYMVGTGGVSLFGAVTQYLIMVLLGLPLALPLAVLAFLLGFIPYIGSFVSTGLAFLVAIAVGTPEDIAIMAIYTIVMNIVQGNFVAPIVYSRAVNLHPAVVLMAIPAGSEVAGILGMFLAVPFLGVIAATWRTVLQVFATQADASSGTPPPEPELEPEVAPADLPRPARPGRVRGRRSFRAVWSVVQIAHHEGARDVSAGSDLEHGARIAGQRLRDVQPGGLEVEAGRLGIGHKTFLEPFQAERLIGGLDLDQFAPGFDTLPFERFSIRLAPLLEGVPLDLLLALDGGDPPAFERAHELVRRLDVRMTTRSTWTPYPASACPVVAASWEDSVPARSRTCSAVVDRTSSRRASCPAA